MRLLKFIDLLHGSTHWSIKEKREAEDVVDQIISDATNWAKTVLDDVSIDPKSPEAAAILAECRIEGEDFITSNPIWGALKVLECAEVLRNRLKSLDASLALLLMFLYEAHHDEEDSENFLASITGREVICGADRGRAARTPKVTAEQKADIRQEMAGAKHGTKKATKEDLAKKHRISVRQIERIAAEK
jgi:hypothetical protein